jgi:transglutaminase-like putative cysteine protease
MAAAGKQPRVDGTGVRVVFTVDYKIIAGPKTKFVEVTIVLPKTLEGRQKVHKIEYSKEPTKVFDEGGYSLARFMFDNPEETTKFAVTVDAEVYRYDLATAMAVDKKQRQFDDKEELEKFKVDEKYLEKDAPELQAIAKKLVGKTEEITAYNTMVFVIANLKRGPFDKMNHGALWALEKKIGDCTEFADLFLALCRANRLPARFCEGYLISDVAKDDTAKHDWAEVYFAKYGWVPFDPFHAKLKSATFNTLRPAYVYLARERQNKVNKSHFVSYRYQGDAIQVEDTFSIKSRKAVKAK